MRRRRDLWRVVLAAEVQRWGALTSDQLLAKLDNPPFVYEVEVDSVIYQVEVLLLENTQAYVHVMLCVDDGSLPASIVPASESFITRKS